MEVVDPIQAIIDKNFLFDAIHSIEKNIVYFIIDLI